MRLDHLLSKEHWGRPSMVVVVVFRYVAAQASRPGIRWVGLFWGDCSGWNIGYWAVLWWWCCLVRLSLSGLVMERDAAGVGWSWARCWVLREWAYGMSFRVRLVFTLRAFVSLSFRGWWGGCGIRPSSRTSLVPFGVWGWALGVGCFCP